MAAIKNAQRRTSQAKRKGTNRPRRPRGAQPENVNALKHGFYSPRFLADEAADLDAFSDGDGQSSLDSELAMMRVAVRRVFDALAGARSVDKQVDLLGALGAASSRVASLLKTKKFLTGGGGDLSAVLEQVLMSVTEELGIE